MYGDKPALRLKLKLPSHLPESRQYPVVCVPSLGWGKRAGKSSSPGEAQVTGSGGFQHSTVAFAYAVPKLLALLVSMAPETL